MIVDNSRKLQLCPPGSRCRNNGSSICQRLRTIPPPTTSTTTTTTAASTSTEGVNKPTEPSIISTEFVLSSTVPTVDDLSTISTSSTTSYSTISENDIPTNSTVSISENIPSSSTTEFIFKTSESSTISSTKNLESTTTNSSTVGYGIESVDASTDMNSTVSISESTPSESFSTTEYISTTSTISSTQDFESTTSTIYSSTIGNDYESKDSSTVFENNTNSTVHISTSTPSSSSTRSISTISEDYTISSTKNLEATTSLIYSSTEKELPINSTVSSREISSTEGSISTSEDTTIFSTTNVESTSSTIRPSTFGKDIESEPSESSLTTVVSNYSTISSTKNLEPTTLIKTSSTVRNDIESIHSSTYESSSTMASISSTSEDSTISSPNNLETNTFKISSSTVGLDIDSVNSSTISQKDITTNSTAFISESTSSTTIPVSTIPEDSTNNFDSTTIFSFGTGFESKDSSTVPEKDLLANSTGSITKSTPSASLSSGQISTNAENSTFSETDGSSTIGINPTSENSEVLSTIFSFTTSDSESTILPNFTEFPTGKGVESKDELTDFAFTTTGSPIEDSTTTLNISYGYSTTVILSTSSVSFEDSSSSSNNNLKSTEIDQIDTTTTMEKVSEEFTVVPTETNIGSKSSSSEPTTTPVYNSTSILTSENSTSSSTMNVYISSQTNLPSSISSLIDSENTEHSTVSTVVDFSKNTSDTSTLLSTGFEEDIKSTVEYHEYTSDNSHITAEISTSIPLTTLGALDIKSKTTDKYDSRSTSVPTELQSAVTSRSASEISSINVEISEQEHKQRPSRNLITSSTAPAISTSDSNPEIPSQTQITTIFSNEVPAITTIYDLNDISTTTPNEYSKTMSATDISQSELESKKDLNEKTKTKMQNIITNPPENITDDTTFIEFMTTAEIIQSSTENPQYGENDTNIIEISTSYENLNGNKSNTTDSIITMSPLNDESIIDLLSTNIEGNSSTISPEIGSKAHDPDIESASSPTTSRSVLKDLPSTKVENVPPNGGEIEIDGNFIPASSTTLYTSSTESIISFNTNTKSQFTDLPSTKIEGNYNSSSRPYGESQFTKSSDLIGGTANVTPNGKDILDIEGNTSPTTQSSGSIPTSTMNLNPDVKSSTIQTLSTESIMSSNTYIESQFTKSFALLSTNTENNVNVTTKGKEDPHIESNPSSTIQSSSTENVVTSNNLNVTQKVREMEVSEFDLKSSPTMPTLSTENVMASEKVGVTPYVTSLEVGNSSTTIPTSYTENITAPTTNLESQFTEPIDLLSSNQDNNINATQKRKGTEFSMIEGSPSPSTPEFINKLITSNTNIGSTFSGLRENSFPTVSMPQESTPSGKSVSSISTPQEFIHDSTSTLGIFVTISNSKPEDNKKNETNFSPTYEIYRTPPRTSTISMTESSSISTAKPQTSELSISSSVSILSAVEKGISTEANPISVPDIIKNAGKLSTSDTKSKLYHSSAHSGTSYISTENISNNLGELTSSDTNKESQVTEQTSNLSNISTKAPENISSTSVVTNAINFQTKSLNAENNEINVSSQINNSTFARTENVSDITNGSYNEIYSDNLGKTIENIFAKKSVDSNFKFPENTTDLQFKHTNNSNNLESTTSGGHSDLDNSRNSHNPKINSIPEPTTGTPLENTAINGSKFTSYSITDMPVYRISNNTKLKIENNLQDSPKTTKGSIHNSYEPTAISISTTSYILKSENIGSNPGDKKAVEMPSSIGKDFAATIGSTDITIPKVTISQNSGSSGHKNTESTPKIVTNKSEVTGVSEKSTSASKTITDSIQETRASTLWTNIKKSQPSTQDIVSTSSLNITIPKVTYSQYSGNIEPKSTVSTTEIVSSTQETNDSKSSTIKSEVTGVVWNKIEKLQPSTKEIVSAHRELQSSTILITTSPTINGEINQTEKDKTTSENIESKSTEVSKNVSPTIKSEDSTKTRSSTSIEFKDTISTINSSTSGTITKPSTIKPSSLSSQIDRNFDVTSEKGLDRNSKVPNIKSEETNPVKANSNITSIPKSSIEFNVRSTLKPVIAIQNSK